MHILYPVEVTRKLDHAVHAKVEAFQTAAQAMAALAHFASDRSPGRRAGKTQRMFELPSQEASMGAPMIPDPEGNFAFAVRFSTWESSPGHSFSKRINSETVLDYVV